LQELIASLEGMSDADKAAALAAMSPEQRAAAMALMTPEERARCEAAMEKLMEDQHQADIAPTAEQYAALEAENAKAQMILMKLEKALNDAHYDVREKSNAIAKLMHFEGEVASLKQQLEEAMHEIERLGGANEGGQGPYRKVPTVDKGTGTGAVEFPPPPGPPNADGSISKPASRAPSEMGDVDDPRLQARERHLAMQEKIRSGAPLSPQPLDDLNAPPKQEDNSDALAAELTATHKRYQKEKEAMEFRLTEQGVKAKQLERELAGLQEALEVAKEDAKKLDKKNKAALKAASASGASREEQLLRIQQSLEDDAVKLNRKIRQLNDDVAAKEQEKADAIQRVTEGGDAAQAEMLKAAPSLGDTIHTHTHFALHDSRFSPLLWPPGLFPPPSCVSLLSSPLLSSPLLSC